MTGKVQISELANIHESAVIGKDCYIGPHVNIEENVVIGDRVRIEAFCQIYHGSIIEDDCYIGVRCSIGSDGFGYAQDQIGRSHFTPQIGVVRLQKNVKLLANSSIDRAAFGEAVIGENTIIGGNCHIAHNVNVGKDCKIWPGFVVAGSTKIGERVEFGYRSNCVGHIQICDDFKCDPMVIINNSVKQAGHYAGTLLMDKAHWTETRKTFDEIPSWELPKE